MLLRSNSCSRQLSGRSGYSRFPRYSKLPFYVSNWASFDGSTARPLIMPIMLILMRRTINNSFRGMTLIFAFNLIPERIYNLWTWRALKLRTMSWKCEQVSLFSFSEPFASVLCTRPGERLWLMAYKILLNVIKLVVLFILWVSLHRL